MKRLGRLAADVQRVVEARIGELADVGDRQRRRFVGRLWFGDTVSVGADVVDRDVEGLRGHAAVVVGDRHRDRVHAVVGVDVAAVERAGRQHARPPGVSIVGSAGVQPACRHPS